MKSFKSGIYSVTLQSSSHSRAQALPSFDTVLIVTRIARHAGLKSPPGHSQCPEPFGSPQSRGLQSAQESFGLCQTADSTLTEVSYTSKVPNSIVEFRSHKLREC